MSTEKVNKTLINIAVKKVLGLAHTSNRRETQNETFPSNVQMSTTTTFGQPVPNVPNTGSLYSIQSASVGQPGTIEYIEFDVSNVVGTKYDEDSYSGLGGSESSDDTFHGYYLSLPTDYEASSSNPKAGTGFFQDGESLYSSRGKLQLVHPLFSSITDGNLYNVKLYNQSGSIIGNSNTIDWSFDFYNGIIFVQDPLASQIPTKVRAFLYIGKYADETITDASGSGGGISYSRTAVTTHVTASTSDTILGVNATASLDIRLPAASAFSSGQYFTVKDEAGNANTYNITIRASGSVDKIDGQSSIVLESPYGAINIYSDGTSKFFIY